MDGSRRRSEPGSEGQVAPFDRNPGLAHPRLTTYRIRVEGHLDDRVAAWPDGTSATREDDGDTVLTVPHLDQAALLGLLRTLRDVGARLVSVNPGGPGGSRTKEREERQ